MASSQDENSLFFVMDTVMFSREITARMRVVLWE